MTLIDPTTAIAAALAPVPHPITLATSLIMSLIVQSISQSFPYLSTHSAASAPVSRQA
jgi:hypothetical protein